VIKSLEKNIISLFEDICCSIDSLIQTTCIWWVDIYVNDVYLYEYTWLLVCMFIFIN